jgi:hypothetical protein
LIFISCSLKFAHFLRSRSGAKGFSLFCVKCILCSFVFRAASSCVDFFFHAWVLLLLISILAWRSGLDLSWSTSCSSSDVPLCSCSCRSPNHFSWIAGSLLPAHLQALNFHLDLRCCCRQFVFSGFPHRSPVPMSRQFPALVSALIFCSANSVLPSS